jgi:hypothetical protein
MYVMPNICGTVPSCGRLQTQNRDFSSRFKISLLKALPSQGAQLKDVTLSRGERGNTVELR